MEPVRRLNCLIIDENQKNNAVLERVLEGLPETGEIHSAVQPYLVRSILSFKSIDVVFIRVRLWDHTLFTACERLPAIVFLNGGREKLTNKERTSVRYSIRTPYYEMDLSLLMKRILREEFNEPIDFLFLRYGGRFHKTLFTDIEMIERKQGSYVELFLSYDHCLMPGPITTWINRLPADKFIRVSDTLVIPVAEASSITGNHYSYKGRVIELTYRFAAQARREMERVEEY